MTRRRFVIRGRVQGVGFRYFIRVHARALDLRGHVQNLPDGAVDVDVAGPAAQIEELVAHCRRGPDGANVTAIEDIAPDESQPELPYPFAIQR
jgi:acylphosphatase